MKKIFILFSVLVFSLFLVACGDKALDAPEISISNGVVSWEAIENADHYLVFVGNDSIQTSETSYDLKTEDLADGSYTIYVVAAVDNSISAQSNSVTYVVETPVDDTIGVPSNLQISDEGVLSWNAVTGATGYIVIVGTTENSASTTNFDLAALDLSDGSYQVKVVALINNDRSNESAAVSYMVETPVEDTVDTPVNLQISDAGILSWDAVTDATAYLVTVGTNEYSASSNSYDLDGLYLDAGTYQVTVVAFVNNDRSNESTAVSYEVEAIVVSGQIYSAVLLSMDESYVPNMVADDFIQDPNDFTYYQMACEIAAFYESKMTQFGMSDQDAIDFFNDFVDMIDSNVNDFASISNILTELEMLEDNNMDSTKFTQLVYGIGMIVLKYQPAFDLLDIDEYEDNLIEAQFNLNSYKESETFTDTYDFLVSYTDSSHMDALMLMFNGDYETYNYLSLFANICFDLYLYDTVNADYYYVNYENMGTGVIDAYIAIAQEIYNSEDSEFLSNVNFHMVDILNELYGLTWEIEDIQQDLVETEADYDRMVSMIAALEDNESDSMLAVKSVVDFLFTIKNNVPSNIVDLIDSVLTEEYVLSPSEMFTIKDELIDVLLLALPEADEFTVFYQLGFGIAGSLGDADLSAFDAYTAYFGEMNEATLELSLYFVQDFTETDLLDINALIERMIDENSGEFNPGLDPYAVIDLLAFVEDYVNDFMANHPDEVAAFNELVNDETNEAFYQLVMDEVINYVEALEENEQIQNAEVLIYVLNQLSNDYDEMISVVALVESIGMDTIDALIESEGSIIDAIMNVYSMDSEDQDAVVLAVSALIDEIGTYNEVVMSQFTLDELTNIMSLVKIPLTINLYLEFELEMTLDEIDTMVNEIYPMAAEFIFDAVELERDLISIVDATDLSFYLGEDGCTTDIELAVDLVVIHVLSTCFSTENVALIDNMVSIIFDDILGIDEIADNVDMVTMAGIQVTVEEAVEEIVSNVQTFAALDFNNLSEQNIEDIKSFVFSLYGGISSLVPSDEENVGELS
ncbi:MAG: hypothetical protein WCR19_05660 [Acholeplasmataceae bacterium]